MTLEHKTDHTGAGLLKLAPPFWGKPRIATFLIAFLDECQALEDAVWTVLDGIDVDTCGWWVLSRLAKIVGEPSRPADVEDLRVRVKARIRINRSSGTREDVAGLVAALVGSGSILERPRQVKVLSAERVR